jgi:hypothetical protein
MVYPMVSTAAVKFYHGDQKDDKGIFPSSFGIFHSKKSKKIVLENVVSIFCHYWDKHCLYLDKQSVWAFRCVENDYWVRTRAGLVEKEFIARMSAVCLQRDTAIVAII